MAQGRLSTGIEEEELDTSPEEMDTMMNPMSEELMFANMKAREAEIRRSFGQPVARSDVRRWWRASQEKRAARRTR